MKFAYYPGCSLKSTGIEYLLSTRAVAARLGIDLWEIPDWICCGASYAHAGSKMLSLALPARSIALAEKEDLDVAVSCAACYNRLKHTAAEVKKSPALKEKVSRIINIEYKASKEVISMIEVFVNHVGLERLKETVVKPLHNLKVASYYGCLLVRPPELAMDDPENPCSLDNITAALCGTPLTWNHKVECCGAFNSTLKPDDGSQMIGKILDDALENGADCIAVACPLCMVNLDMRQKDVNRKRKVKLKIPIFYYTELMGLAMGIPVKELGITKHFVDAMPLMRRKTLL